MSWPKPPPRRIKFAANNFQSEVRASLFSFSEWPQEGTKSAKSFLLYILRFFAAEKMQAHVH
jgi:hypothetical protein